MKLFILAVAVLLTGCTTPSKFVCYGAGTCFGDERDNEMTYASSSSVPDTYRPSTGISSRHYILPSGGYSVTRSGSLTTVIQTSKTRGR